MEIRAPNGTYVGRRSGPGNVCRFLGIPFARAERWRRPEPVTTTAADRIPALSYGPSPWQDPTQGAMLPGGMDAECLNLNLYMAHTGESRRPVMVWIYGGAQIGGNNVGMCPPDLPEVRYDGGAFVAEDPGIILAVPNYRVGLWGSMDLSGLPDAGEEYRYAPNLARLDILACLRWLRENIAAFGGDPENITLFGQSAGSSNITALMHMPEARGQFQKAICQSSFAMDISLTSARDCRRVSEALLEKLGCSTVAQALQKSDGELLAAQTAVAAASMGGSSAFGDIESKLFSPVVDGTAIPADYWARFLRGEFGNVRFLGGTNAGEYDQQFAPMAGPGGAEKARRFAVAQNWGKLDPERGFAPEITDRFLSQYKEDRSAFQACEDLKADLYLRMGAMAFALVCSQFGDAYLYHLALPREGGRRFAHGEEIPILFGTDRTTPGETQRFIRDAWRGFARQGDPNGPWLKESWRPFTPEHWDTLLLTDRPQMVRGVRPADCRLLLPLLRESREVPGFARLCRLYED